MLTKMDAMGQKRVGWEQFMESHTDSLKKVNKHISQDEHVFLARAHPRFHMFMSRMFPITEDFLGLSSISQ